MRKWVLRLIFLVVAMHVAANLSRAQTVFAFATNGNFVFAATDSGVYRSSDNGRKWTAVKSGLPDESIFALAKTGTALVAGASSKGVFLSSDYGDSWNAVNGGLEDSYIISISALAVNGTSLFAALLTGEGIIRSTDMGQSWALVNNGLPAESYVRSIVATDRYLLAASTHGIYRSSDNGDNWERAMGDLTDSSDAPLAISGKTIYACASTGLFFSKDNGGHWKPVEIPLRRWTKDISIHSFAAEGKHLFVGTFFDGIFRSLDDGKTWTTANRGLRTFSDAGLGAIEIQSITIVEGAILAGTSQGIFRSTDDGANWANVYPVFMPAGSEMLTPFSEGSLDGFLGIQWGASHSTAKKAMRGRSLLPAVKLDDGTLEYYGGKFGSFEVSKWLLHFGEDGFYGADLEIDPEDKSKYLILWNQVKDDITIRYGKPGVDTFFISTPTDNPSMSLALQSGDGKKFCTWQFLAEPGFPNVIGLRIDENLNTHITYLNYAMFKKNASKELKDY